MPLYLSKISNRLQRRCLYRLKLHRRAKRSKSIASGQCGRQIFAISPQMQGIFAESDALDLFVGSNDSKEKHDNDGEILISGYRKH